MRVRTIAKITHCATAIPTMYTAKKAPSFFGSRKEYARRGLSHSRIRVMMKGRVTHRKIPVLHV